MRRSVRKIHRAVICAHRLSDRCSVIRPSTSNVERSTGFLRTTYIYERPIFRGPAPVLKRLSDGPPRRKSQIAWRVEVERSPRRNVHARAITPFPEGGGLMRPALGMFKHSMDHRPKKRPDE